MKRFIILGRVGALCAIGSLAISIVLSVNNFKEQNVLGLIWNCFIILIDIWAAIVCQWLIINWKRELNKLYGRL